MRSLTGTGKYLFLLTLLFIGQYVRAQLPGCGSPSDTLVYYLYDNKIFNYAPNQLLSPTNPKQNTIVPPVGASGLTISNNLNGGVASPTFYTVVSNYYYYYDGSTWVNTGHTAKAVNLGAGGGYIFSLNGSDGTVYRYDGTGSATLLTTIADYPGGGPFDCVADCYGNFYLMRVAKGSTPDKNFLRKYDYNGVLLNEWQVLPDSKCILGGGSMAIINNRVYTQHTFDCCKGILDGNKLVLKYFDSIDAVDDYASCMASFAGVLGTARASRDTIYVCDTLQKATVYSVSDSLGDFVSWEVLSGNATIDEQGDTITLDVKTNARVLLRVSDISFCGSLYTDTVDFIVPTATVDAGSGKLLFGCGDFADTLNATLTDTLKGIKYEIGWEPASIIKSGGNTLQPVANPDETTTFTITIRTPQHGNCMWSDTVTTEVQKRVEAILEISDTVVCTNEVIQFSAAKSVILPTEAGATYKWEFGDGSTSGEKEPKYAYPKQGDYSVTLRVKDAGDCEDIATTKAYVYAPPAVWLGPDTAICIGGSYTLPITSTSDKIASYKWQDNSIAPTFNVVEDGTYTVTVSNNCMSVSDTVSIEFTGCSVWFPSAFSPNGDTKNDRALLKGNLVGEITYFEMSVYNRRGQRVYYSKDINEGWDGRHKGSEAAQDVYYYMIRYSVQGSGSVNMMKGDILLLR